MIYTEILEDGRTHTYSDTYKIRQVETGVVYDDAVDVIHHDYEETNIPVSEDEITNEEAYNIIMGVRE